VYLRLAALGDSATFGIGDPVPGGWRGWSRLLAESLGSSYDLSYCNLAVSGSTATDVLRHQLRDAVAHRPDLASLVVGVNDTMRATWDPLRLRRELMVCAELLTDTGAQLLTVRYHDHGAVFGLPGFLRRAMSARLARVNEAYDEVYARYGGLRVDLALRPDVFDREFWSVDRLHPSELGHRALARGFADLLLAQGYEFEPPTLAAGGGREIGWRDDVSWMVREGVPWMGRRARDFGPLLNPLPAGLRRGLVRR
jgi:lysophospholipase L1-like esterase